MNETPVQQSFFDHFTNSALDEIQRLNAELRAERTDKAELRTLAATDFLTGLPNRAGILDTLQKVHSQASRTGIGYCLILADIDKFKSINDVFGHQAGDDILWGTATTLNEGHRPYDSVGRYGGEEFLLVLPACHSVDDGIKIGDRVRRNVEATPSESTKDGVFGLPVTVSLGVVFFDPNDETTKHMTPEMMIIKADEALYRAKVKGDDEPEGTITRNRIAACLLPSEDVVVVPRTPALPKREAMRRLTQALGAGITAQMPLAFQPN